MPGSILPNTDPDNNNADQTPPPPTTKTYTLNIYISPPQPPFPLPYNSNSDCIALACAFCETHRHDPASHARLLVQAMRAHMAEIDGCVAPPTTTNSSSRVEDVPAAPPLKKRPRKEDDEPEHGLSSSPRHRRCGRESEWDADARAWFERVAALATRPSQDRPANRIMQSVRGLFVSNNSSDADERARRRPDFLATPREDERVPRRLEAYARDTGDDAVGALRRSKQPSPLWCIDDDYYGRGRRNRDGGLGREHPGGFGERRDDDDDDDDDAIIAGTNTAARTTTTTGVDLSAGTGIRTITNDPQTARLARRMLEAEVQLHELEDLPARVRAMEEANRKVVGRMVRAEMRLERLEGMLRRSPMFETQVAEWDAGCWVQGKESGG